MNAYLAVAMSCAVASGGSLGPEAGSPLPWSAGHSNSIPVDLIVSRAVKNFFRAHT